MLLASRNTATLADARNAREFHTLSALSGVTLRLDLDEIEIPLLPRPPRLSRVDGLWHRVEEKAGLRLSLLSQDDKPRVLHLETQCESPFWSACQVKFSHAARTTVGTENSEAIGAQDTLSEDGTVLQLLLLPGEAREVALTPQVALDDGVPAGDYAFDIIVSNAGEGSAAANEAVTSEGSESVSQSERDVLVAVLKLRHPSSTFLAQLPAIYGKAVADQARREAGQQGSYCEPAFFERFLRGFEDATLPLEATLSDLDCFFSARSAPSEFLPWLATWVALVLDENWPELKRRRLIREAVELFRWRGTQRGLSRYLEIYTGVTPEINDRPFQGMKLGSHRLGEQMKLGNVLPHTFVVNLAVDALETVNERVVRDIIESVKPAHTAYVLRIVQRTYAEHGSTHDHHEH